MDRVMAALEEAEAGGTQGGAEAVWKGGGMDAQVDAWFRRELVRCRNERHERRRRGQATTALGARRKALRDVRKALAHYARDGEQIVDMTQEGAA